MLLRETAMNRRALAAAFAVGLCVILRVLSLTLQISNRSDDTLILGIITSLAAVTGGINFALLFRQKQQKPDGGPQKAEYESIRNREEFLTKWIALESLLQETATRQGYA